MPIQLVSSPKWTCPRCSVSVRVPEWSHRIACACGGVYLQEATGTRLERINTTIAQPRRGPGTELRKMLGCGCCAKWLDTMDEWGPDLCLEQIETIVQWLGEGHSPIEPHAARRMILLAIERSSNSSPAKPQST